MNKHPEYLQEYMGLPIPDAQEFSALWFELFENTSEQDLSMHGLTDLVKGIAPNINRVEAHDVRVWKQNESSPDFSENEVEQFVFGISAGYDFAITSFTLLAMLRSGARSMSEYLSEAPNLLGGLPVLSMEELRRVIQVRIGRAPIDEHYENRYVQDSVDLAAHDMGDYMFEAHYMGKILEKQIELIYEYSDSEEEQDDQGENFDETQAYVEGFQHGFQNAAQMYIQSYEEQILQPLEEDLRG